MLIYAAIEDAIIARIKSASDAGALGYRLAEVASYGGEFDDEAFFTSVRKLPAVWVTVVGSKAKRIGAKVFDRSPVIAVMVATRNVRGERQTRHGSVNEPGSYQLLDDVCSLISGQSLGLNIAPLMPGADRTLFNTRNAREARSVLALEFSTTFTYRVTDPLAEGDDLLSLDLKYYLKPGDDTEDATDTLTVGA
jgi:phage gp37-like protein